MEFLMAVFMVLVAIAAVGVGLAIAVGLFVKVIRAILGG